MFDVACDRRGATQRNLRLPNLYTITLLRAAGSCLGELKQADFRKMMQVALVNDGPVTILLDSRRGF